MKTKNGFTLIELMMSLGVMSLLILSGLSMSTYFSQLSRTQKVLVDQIELRRAFDSVLAENCTCNFIKPGSEKSYIGTGDLIIDQLNFYTDSTCGTAQSTVIAPTGAVPWATSGLKVTTMMITNIIAKSPGNYIGDLKINFDQSNGPISPFTTISKPFSFSTNSSKKLNACSYLKASSSGSSATNSLNLQKLSVTNLYKFVVQSVNTGVTNGSTGQPWMNSVCTLSAPLTSPFNDDGSGNPLVMLVTTDCADSFSNNNNNCMVGAQASVGYPACPTGYTAYDSCSNSTLAQATDVQYQGEFYFRSGYKSFPKNVLCMKD